MADPMTFETRFAAALDRYADRVPVTVDVDEVLRATSRARRDRASLIGWRPRWSTGLRLAIAVALLALGAAILLLVGNRPTLPFGGGGLMVGIDATGWVFDPDLGVPRPLAGGCPATLVDGGTQLATYVRFGATTVQPIDGDVSTRVAIRGRSGLGSNTERWSPDGSRYAWVLFGQQQSSDPVDSVGTITVMSIHGVAKPVQAIFRFPGLAAYAWSPNSDHIAALLRHSNAMELVDIDVAAQTNRTIATYRSPKSVEAPPSPLDLWWTAHGTKIAVSVGTDAGDKPALVDVASGAIALVPDPANLFGPDLYVLGSDWSPDGARLVVYELGGTAFVVDSAGSRLFDLPTGQLTGTKWGLEPWAPDSRHLALVDGTNLRIVGADGTDVGSLPLGSTGNAYDPTFAWSPDGGTIAIVQFSRSGIELAFYDTSSLERMGSTSIAVDPATPATQLCLQWVPPIA